MSQVLPMPRRRWFQFGLGTMFLLVTVVALGFGWRAWCLDWIQQRHEFIADEWAARKGKKDPYTHFVQIYPPSKEHKQPSSLHGFPPPVHTDKDPDAPLMLHFFGEEGVSGLFVLVEGPSSQELTSHDVERVKTARRLFPEASVAWFHLSDDGSGTSGFGLPKDGEQ